MKSRRKTLLWQANIILIGIKFYTVQKCSMQSKMPESNSLGPWWSPLAPACIRIRHSHLKPSPVWKDSIPSGAEYPDSFPKTVCNPRNRHPGVHAASQLHSITATHVVWNTITAFSIYYIHLFNFMGDSKNNPFTVCAPLRWAEWQEK